MCKAYLAVELLHKGGVLPVARHELGVIPRLRKHCALVIRPLHHKITLLERRAQAQSRAGAGAGAGAAAKNRRACVPSRGRGWYRRT